ncbi:iron ABC transporter permease [Paraglaciecola aquimarina]|uniref:Iron ABC transporter permease n=1 Tax=Paraglaciecola algarum TaxID=3050085 RepID=A0ABS9D2K8_9ALTE|nr:iron ABC transporter permease [Paraglaciecola sp. G1-23]MCF2946712.1 iron ABC transporter permease [Paraglaciecola sp. G1-23]
MRHYNWLNPWFICVVICCVILASPIVLVFSSLAFPQLDVWQHLYQTVLSDYVTNSLLLAFGVGALVILIGAPLAWFIARYDFYARRQIKWLVLLPMAMPAYILAYSYTGLLDFAGPVQGALRTTFDWQYGDYYFPEIRSLSGAILMLSLVLYPYVYMLAKTAFSDLPANLEEVSKSLGVTANQFITKVVFPLARPAILMGAALAMMEAFADYGTVQYFGISTFTTGIFRTWFGLGNGIAAAQLAAMLTSFVVLLLVLEYFSRRKVKYYLQGQKSKAFNRQVLHGYKSVVMAILCVLPVIFGFLIPVLQLVGWAIDSFTKQFDQAFIQLIWNSFYLAAITAICAVILALFFAYAKRLNRSKVIHLIVSFVGLGYALPGTVIAIGALVILSWLDIQINGITEAWFEQSVGLILSGTLFALVLVYCIRFLAVAMHNVDSGIARIKPSLDDAAKSLGHSSFSILKNIHVPLLTSSVCSSLLLVFVDVMKELPATLILRPFNFNTLAVKTFELASDERLMEAALPALAIVIVGIIPVIFLTRMTEQRSPQRTSKNKGKYVTS